MIEQHLPALQVVIPLIAAPVCLLVHRPKLAWLVATAASWTAFVIALVLLHTVRETGPLSYALGGWAAPWGIEYRVDTINAFLLLIVAGISSVVVVFAGKSVEREIEPDRIYLFYTAWVLCLTGLLGIAITGDVFNLFVFLEISSLSTYALIALGSHRRALMAAYRYLVMGTIGATFIVIGIGFLYAMTGTLNMMDLAARLPAVSNTRTVAVAFAFLTVGIGLKVALFPLHAWLPNAYTYAPSAVSALLAGTATKVGVYVLLRFLFTVFGGSFPFKTLALDGILLVLAVVAVLSGALVAIFQTNLKRMLAYSSVAQIGYMVLGISLTSITGLMATIVHLFNHALIKTALFMALGSVFYRFGSVSLDGIAGLGRRMPWTMAAFVAGGLSLIGVPMSVGFISKWYLISAALEQGLWPVVAVIIVGSLLAVVYVWRVVEAAYFQPAAAGAAGAVADKREEAPLGMLIPIWFLVAANLYFGLDASLTTGVARQAAEMLLGDFSPATGGG
uniref:Multisubunit sodium/proton antiporter, MrpD subunit n=1 Tax=Candidatus Kentrum eta TaxID=2126337 RepID=A0A450URP0_9GAMM|nr:MAG: multisubunit sodium/proton antiporter, MrpD subunit [Candidatus Kentron sp. H]VFJ95187.1 MAG: multisubunit sodium/proton antiporter, MrpD subunit [Candidatus Kentron sp. H]VFK01746.1 MAG: multisubunit sodium/proton antiporter, MrpD subunit [Candidatus Kentron sp. H]